jgi:hypothetical protein
MWSLLIDSSCSSGSSNGQRAHSHYSPVTNHLFFLLHHSSFIISSSLVTIPMGF